MRINIIRVIEILLPFTTFSITKVERNLKSSLVITKTFRLNKINEDSDMEHNIEKSKSIEKVNHNILIFCRAENDILPTFKKSYIQFPCI